MFVLLDNSSGAGDPSLLFAEPTGVVVANEPAEVDAALQALEAGLARGLHAAGYFSYELGYVLEPRLAGRLPARRAVPLLWFGLFEHPRPLSEADVLNFLAAEAEPPELGPVTPDWTREAYGERFARAHAMIESGHIYQLNLTFKVRFRLPGPPLSLYRELRGRQPVAHGAFLDAGGLSIVSLSPEQFFARDGDAIVSRPMKGTAARGNTAEADTQARLTLASDPKQRAENLMIVDLMRNDIGRMAEIGSVSVSDLFTVESFKTVHQMTSGIQARLRAEVGPRDLLQALFPPGSVTGAPKIRAMELIADLEGAPRGVYCGAIGYFAPDNIARFNVAIRTAVIDAGGRGEMGIGSGVVADSVGVDEYAECLLKMAFLGTPVAHFSLIETLLYRSGDGYWLLDRHLSRLQASAGHFGFVYREPEVRAALAEAAAGLKGARSRVRLLLHPGGGATITTTPLPDPAPATVMRYVFAPEPVTSGDPWLAHKTTNRSRYDGDWQRAHDELGADEVVYVNERGELTEGSRTNLFVARRGGDRLLTPTLDCGVLPGVLRAELIAAGRAVEAVLTCQVLAEAEAVYLGNSVRDLVRAEPLTRSPISRK